MDLLLNSLTPTEQQFLWEMLYLALYVPPGVAPFTQDIVFKPEIAKYAADWGKSNDLGLYAVDRQSGQKIGAAWLRLFTNDNRGYGFVDDTTPELSMAVLPNYRGQGIGSRLLAELLSLAEKIFPAVSLSVAKGNPAVRLYEKFGFMAIETNEHSLVMLRRPL